MRASTGGLFLAVSLVLLGGCVTPGDSTPARLTMTWPLDASAPYADRADAIAAALDVELVYWIAPYDEGTAVTMQPRDGTLRVSVENPDGSRFTVDYAPEHVPGNATTKRVVFSDPARASPLEWYLIPADQTVNSVTFAPGGDLLLEFRPGTFVGSPTELLPALLERLGTALRGSIDDRTPTLDRPFGEAGHWAGLSYTCTGCDGTNWQEHVRIDGEPTQVGGINGTAAVFDGNGSLIRLEIQPRALIHGDLLDEEAARAVFAARLHELGYRFSGPPWTRLVGDTAAGLALYCGFSTLDGEEFMWSACIDAATGGPVEEHLEWTNDASGELPALPPWS